MISDGSQFGVGVRQYERFRGGLADLLHREDGIMKDTSCSHRSAACEGIFSFREGRGIVYLHIYLRVISYIHGRFLERYCVSDAFKDFQI